MPCSPTHIPHKVNKSARFIPQGNVYKRVTEDDACGAQNPKPHSTVLGAAFERDCTSEVECGYNIARQRGLWGMQIVNYVCYYAGITQKRALKYLKGKPLTKLKLDK